METIEKSIRDLLFIHDCVIIPGFGGFVGNYCSAKMNSARQTLIPPTKTILFNKNLVRNDGLLINHLAEEENLNYAEASRLVRKFIETLYLKLDSGKAIHLDGIGKIIYDEHHTLQFTPEYESNFLINSFGLGEFSFPELEKLTDEIIEKRFTDTSGKKHKTNSSRLRKYTILALAIGLMISPIKTSLFENIQKSSLLPDTNSFTTNNPIAKQIEQSTQKRVALFYEESENTVSEVNQNKESDIVKEIDEAFKNKPENNIKASNSDIETKVPNSNGKMIKGMNYLIAGCFREETNAQYLKSQLESKGLNPVLYAEKGLYRISLGEFESKNDANNEVSRIRQKDSSVQVWVMLK